MRRRQFMQLLDMLRAELDISTDPAVGSSATPRLKQVLARTYETLYDAYTWPFLRNLTERKTLQIGQRYYDFPDNLDYDEIIEAKNWWGGQPHIVTRGIGFEHYAAVDSDSGSRADPVERWEIVDDGNGKVQFEVWPVPAGSGQEFQFRAKRRFRPLVNDDDLCLLDDHLVVLYAAAELAPPKKKTDIQTKLVAAQARLGILKANGASGTPSVRIGLAQSRPKLGTVTIRASR